MPDHTSKPSLLSRMWRQHGRTLRVLVPLTIVYVFVNYIWPSLGLPAANALYAVATPLLARYTVKEQLGFVALLVLSIHMVWLLVRKLRSERINRLHDQLDSCQERVRAQMQQQLAAQAAQQQERRLAQQAAAQAATTSSMQQTAADSEAGPAQETAASSVPSDAAARTDARQQHYARLQALADEAAAQRAAEQRAHRAAAAAAAAATPIGSGTAPATTTEPGVHTQPAMAAQHAAQQRAAEAAEASAATATPANESGGQQHQGRQPSPQPQSSVPARRGMISREAAQAAEAQQQRWLQQLSQQLNAPTPSAALLQQRDIIQQQDAEYAASLSADQARMSEQQQEEEKRRAIAKRLRELQQLKLQLRESLPPEPIQTRDSGRTGQSQSSDAGAVHSTPPDSSSAVQVQSSIGAMQPGVGVEQHQEAVADSSFPSTGHAGVMSERVISVRVRLPDGSTNTRRWLASHTLAQVYDWVQSLEALPLWEPDSWRLVQAYPRTMLSRDSAHSSSLADVCDASSNSLALFAERV